jgi:L-Ala-D/L-Glu epimerase
MVPAPDGKKTWIHQGKSLPWLIDFSYLRGSFGQQPHCPMPRITHLDLRLEALPLTRPYTIAYRTVSAVEIVLLELHTDSGLVGLGAANPSPRVVGEDPQQAFDTLQAHAEAWLLGEDVRETPRLLRQLASELPQQPGSLAAVDIALHDLYAQHLGLPLAKCLGQVHHSLPTSITVGIKDVADTLAEAKEYVAAGFTHLKVKLGHDLDEDLARLRGLRERFGDKVFLRVDANQGYDRAEFMRLMQARAELGLELIEQPVPVAQTATLAELPPDLRRWVALDEALCSTADAFRWVQEPRPAGIFNIKLMKCGGIAQAQRMAFLADLAGLELMWGCNDESIISISAALHVAFACPSTRYIDLDGSLDLARDWVSGGFTLEKGQMRLLDRPGLGLSQS